MTSEPALSRRNARIAAHPGLAGLPPRWKSHLTQSVTQACKHFLLPHTVDAIVDDGIAAFRATHNPHGLDLTAGDGEIGDHARRQAERAALLLSGTQDAETKQALIAQLSRAAHVPEPQGASLDAKIKRLSCVHWWRRQLRRQHARTLENGHIRLHLVQAKRDPYASRDALLRSLRQEARNRLWMEAAVLQNEHGDRFTLQELAEKNTSNKAIRRAELMTRIRGMEDIAAHQGDCALFVTITCPSCYHATLRDSGQANPAYGGHTPRQAQDYLCALWGRIRTKLTREGINLYGLRVAEPHHDGCPHWHLIMFVPPHHATQLQNIIRHYALEAHPDETGAAKNRCHIVPITADKGSATGYIAKYIAKNIDGYQLETDLTGEPMLTTSVSVMAWSKTHGIRQFQAFGAGSVMVWRELRRLSKRVIDDAPEHIQSAWHAAQKTVTAEGDTEQRADYAAYLMAQGGVALPRKDARIRLAKIHDDTPGRYGEALGEKPIGIVDAAAPFKVYESTRYTWTRIDTKATHINVPPIAEMIDTSGSAQAQAMLKKSGCGLPWTRVNNYTQENDDDMPPMPCWMENMPPDDWIMERARC